MNKILLKISNSLNSHDSIIMGCSTFGRKNVLTLKRGYIMYWVKVYRTERIIEKYYYRRLADAKEAIYHYKKNNPEFKYNNYNGGLKRYVHEQ